MNHWGRIFFGYDDQQNLKWIKGQPLHNHTENCRFILEQFSSFYFHPETKDRLMKAVSLHDSGKKETFRIKTDDEDSGKFSYSFAGHRFRVPHDDPYVDGLIRSHHEFSVEQINREKAHIESAEDKKRFPDDLYLLCMADQIEAELAVKTVEKKKDDLSRTFMEFSTIRLTDKVPGDYTVVPWPFEPESFTLSFELKTLPLEGLKKNDPKTIEEALKKIEISEKETLTITLRGK